MLIIMFILSSIASLYPVILLISISMSLSTSIEHSISITSLSPIPISYIYPNSTTLTSTQLDHTCKNITCVEIIIDATVAME
jgi:hypothetical protein